MDKFEVVLHLESVAHARIEAGHAQKSFNADVEKVMARLLPEAAKNMMSVEEVGAAVNMTPSRVRRLMRDHGLNPRDGKRMLAAQAAETLATNAALLSVEPAEFDLMSPLAYLPMGSQLREFLETRVDVDEIIEEDPLREAARNLLDFLRCHWTTLSVADLAHNVSPVMAALDEALDYPPARNYPVVTS